jgi:hypothetical protein
MSSKVASVAQIVGAILTSVGVGLIFIPAGIIIGGIFSILFGIAIERR